MDDKHLMIPYVIVESMISRLERVITKLWVALLVMIALFVGSNIAWFFYESQFADTITTTTQEVTQDTDGGNNYVVGGDYGKTER